MTKNRRTHRPLADGIDIPSDNPRRDVSTLELIFANPHDNLRRQDAAFPLQVEMKVRRYEMHVIYPIIFAIILISCTDGMVKEILDPSTNIVSGGVGATRYMPKPILWIVIVCGWWKFFTTVYRIEISDQGMITLKSLVKKKKCLRRDEIISITHDPFFLNIKYTGGKASVSRLIDGVSDVSSLFESPQQRG